MLAVESAASLRGVPSVSRMNSNFSTPVPPVSVAMRPNLTKLPSSVYSSMPACWYWSVPSKATFVVAVQATRRRRAQHQVLGGVDVAVDVTLRGRDVQRARADGHALVAAHDVPRRRRDVSAVELVQDGGATAARRRVRVEVDPVEVGRRLVRRLVAERHRADPRVGERAQRRRLADGQERVPVERVERRQVRAVRVDSHVVGERRGLREHAGVVGRPRCAGLPAAS